MSDDWILFPRAPAETGDRMRDLFDLIKAIDSPRWGHENRERLTHLTAGERDEVYQHEKENEYPAFLKAHAGLSEETVDALRALLDEELWVRLEQNLVDTVEQSEFGRIEHPAVAPPGELATYAEIRQNLATFSHGLRVPFTSELSAANDNALNDRQVQVLQQYARDPAPPKDPEGRER